MLNRNLRKTLLFIMFSLLFSGLALVVTHFSNLKAPGDSGFFIVIAAYFAGPLLSALLVEKIMFHEHLLKTLDLNFVFNLWSIAALAVPLVLVPLSLGLGLLMPDAVFAAARFNFLDIVKGILAGGTIISIITFFAVCGFAGLLFKELVYLGFWPSSYLTGVFAALWLFPLLYMTNYYDANYLLSGLLMILPFIIAVFPVFTFVKCKTKNIFVPSILAGILFATAPIAQKLIFGGELLLLGINGLAGIIAALLLTAVIFVYNRFLTEAYKRVY
ncbi:MAG: hypothetical protein V1752_04810 [Candidatus Firestonebacteria bacterium]